MHAQTIATWHATAICVIEAGIANYTMKARIIIGAIHSCIKHHIKRIWICITKNFRRVTSVATKLRAPTTT
jgi:hypothetical protein